MAVGAGIAARGRSVHRARIGRDGGAAQRTPALPRCRRPGVGRGRWTAV